jgi:hypothetical protein
VGLLRKLKVAAENPMMVGCYAWSRVNAASLLDIYRRRARRAGFDRLYFILSFDCDTENDIATAWPLHERLMKMGICPAYAVPGVLLAKGAEVFRRIAATGAEFLNHGYHDHMYFDQRTGRYESCWFYDELSMAEIEADVIAGDRNVVEIIGTRPRGFRAPHFGTFQTESQLKFLHRLLVRLGYVYSTSTTPGFGLCYGPAFRRYGLTEIPVSGRGSNPFEILDSWSCFARPDRVLGPNDYHRDAALMSARLGTGPGLLNYYADPSHVADQPIFFETMGELIEHAQPTTYRDLIARLPQATALASARA